nr:M28 family peptidase [Candidatus Sigynarchaeota archaeon]
MTQMNSTRDHVLILVDPALDGRNPGSEGSIIARNYIIERFKVAGLVPLFDDETSFTQNIKDDGDVAGINIGGIIHGDRPGYVLAGAHYDHFNGDPGADDNAAAVAQVIAAAETLGKAREYHGSSIVFLAFDCEEPPYFHGDTMGSTFFVNHCPVPFDAIRVAIILDLTGHDVPIKGLADCLFALGTEYASRAHKAVMNAAALESRIRV